MRVVVSAHVGRRGVGTTKGQEVRLSHVVRDVWDNERVVRSNHSAFQTARVKSPVEIIIMIKPATRSAVRLVRSTDGSANRFPFS